MSVFVKRYADPARGAAARAHLRWLDQLDSGIRLPVLHPGTPTHLLTERLTGLHAGPDDLPAVAAALGRLHGTAYVQELHVAHLHRPHTTAHGLTIPDFVSSRRGVLEQVTVDIIDQPAALYKDTNLRNVIITDTGPAFVDFDDLTLAPFGYDLAKLVVSTAMTCGRLAEGRIAAALDAYNAHVEASGGPATACQPAQLDAYAEIHHHLTAPYLHSNGYQHLWTTVRR